MDLKLANKKVVITGGSRGIGASLVQHFAAEGARVYFCARNQAGIDSLINSLAQYDNIFGYAVDAANQDEFAQWLGSIGDIDIFIPNVSALSGSWQESFNVDVMCTVNNIDAAIPLMTSPDAAITFIGSVSAAQVDDRLGGYGAMKAALTHHMQSLAKKYATKIRVNTVAPGSTLFADGGWDKVRLAHPEVFKNIADALPMKRLARVEEIANVAVFVSSPLASYMSGEVVHVDGGARNTVSL